MKLYHVSCKEYEIGKKFTSKISTQYHLKKIANGEGWVDLKLNEFKPEGAPNRDQCFYAFDSLANCFAYIDSEKCSGGGPYYYEVKMINPIAAPMSLNNIILKKGEESDEIESIANEYWNPTLNWKFIEYLSIEMEIIATVDSPVLMEKISGKNNYDLDYELGNKTFCK